MHHDLDCPNHDDRTRTPPHGDALLAGAATRRAMAGPEIPHNEAAVPIIPLLASETVEQLKREFNIRGAGDVSPHSDTLLRPGKDYELQGNEIVPGGNTARIAELEEAFQFKRNVIISDGRYLEFAGDWIAVPREDFERARKVLENE